MRKRLVLAAVPVVLVGVAALPSSAAPKQTKGTFTAAGSPDPTATAGEVCQGLNPSSRFEVPLKLTKPGKLQVEIKNFQGDWDLTVEGSGGSVLAQSAGFVEATTESIAIKIKKPQTVTIVACNFAGGPTAAGSYVFTPTK